MALLQKLTNKVKLKLQANIFIIILLAISVYDCRSKKHEITYTDSVGNAVRLHVVEKGRGKPILFIHGNSFNHEVWKKQFQSDNMKDYRLIAYDLRGHGESVKFNNPDKAHQHYSLSLHAEDLRYVIKELKLKDVVVVGWSLGGNIILRYLADNPSPPIAKAVVLGAVPSNGFSREPDFRNYPAGPFSPEINYLLKNFFLNPALSDEVANNFVKMVLGSNPAKFELTESNLDEPEIRHFAEIVKKADGFSRLGLTHGLLALMEDLSDGKPDIPVTDERIKNIWQMELLGYIAHYRTPLKIILSKNDVFPLDQIRYIKKLNPEFIQETMEHDGGHAIFYTNPEIFEKELLGYLED